MLRSNNDVLHPGILSDTYPLCSVEFVRIELGQKPAIGFEWNLSRFAYPLSVAVSPHPFSSGNRVQPPMNEHSKARFSPPVHARILLRLRLGRKRLQGSDR